MGNTREPDVVAAGVLEFAKRWDSELRRAAGRVACSCQSADILSESEHEPGCPVHVLLRSGRLMVEEAASGLSDIE
jgi:hypothetical protein